MRVLTFLPILLAPVLARPASAQQPTPVPGGAPPSTATAIGAVFDSVRLRPLAGARVRVDTSDLFATADADGRFRLEGIPVGTHQLRVEHPMLDTLGIALRSPVETYRAGMTLAAQLTTPAPETLIGLVCAPAWRTRGPAALMGRVREADSGVPATGAKVSLVWYELDVSSNIRRAPRVREATVGVDGTYRICGLPTQLEGKLQVISGPLTSGDITINFGHDVLFLRSMSIAPASAVAPVAPNASPDSTRPATAQFTLTGTARLTGKVLNHAGRPLHGARVQVDGTTRVASTRESGDFFIDSLPPGTQTVSVRLLGYAPVEEAVDLSSREPRNVTIRLTDFVPVLEAVRVTATRERALDAIGFTRRKRGAAGHFMEGDAINNNALNFSDVMRIAPGIRIVPVGGRQMIASTRSSSGCVQVWIDGTVWQQLEPGDIDDFVKPHELAAIEVYSPATTPVEFQGARGGACATIVAWTVRRLDRKR